MLTAGCIGGYSQVKCCLQINRFEEDALFLVHSAGLGCGCKPVVLNLFAEGAKSRLTTLLEIRTKNFNTSELTRFRFIAERSLLHKIL